MVLPFNFKPTLGTYLYQAYPFGILENPQIPSAMLSLNIQLRFQRAIFGPYVHHLAIYPPLDLQAYARLGLFHQHLHFKGRAPPALLGRFPSLVAECLNAGRYVYLYADYFHLPGTAYHQRRHFRHDLLIYGHDAATAAFKGALFTNDRRFGSIDIPNDKLIAAIGSDYARGEGCADYCKGDLLLSLAPTSATSSNAELDLPGIRAQIESYLSSSASFTIKGSNHSEPKEINYGDKAQEHHASFGRSVYAEIADYFNEFASKNDFRYDVRVTRLLLEHKSLMGKR